MGRSHQITSDGHQMDIRKPSDGHFTEWVLYPNFSNGRKLFFKDYINVYIYGVFLCTFYFVFIMLCYIFFAVKVALSILSKSNLHPFCIWCVWMLYSIVWEPILSDGHLMSIRCKIFLVWTGHYLNKHLYKKWGRKQL